MEIRSCREDEVNRKQLSHVLRAAARAANDPEIIVIGSQSILASFDEADLPVAVTMSIEADICFRNDADERHSDLVEGSIGELSSFHKEFGYYAQGVSITTATLPAGWEDRVVAYKEGDFEPSRAVCIDPHDLAVSKLVAGRQKDIEFANALLEVNLVSAKILLERTEMLEVPRSIINRVRSTISRLSNSFD